MSYDNPPPGGYGSTPAPPPGGGGYGAPGYGPPGYGPPAGNSKKAVWSLVLGILGLVCCGFLTGIPAAILGRSAQKEIDASGGRLSGRGMATAGFVLGLIAIVLGIVGVVLALTGQLNYGFTTSP